MYRMHDVFWVLSQWDSEIYSDRSQVTLRKLANTETLDFDSDPLFAYISFESEPDSVFIQRRTGVMPRGVKRQFWQKLYEFGTTHSFRSIDEMVDAWKKRQREKLN